MLTAIPSSPRLHTANTLLSRVRAFLPHALMPRSLQPSGGARATHWIWGKCSHYQFTACWLEIRRASTSIISRKCDIMNNEVPFKKRWESSWKQVFSEAHRCRLNIHNTRSSFIYTRRHKTVQWRQKYTLMHSHCISHLYMRDLSSCSCHCLTVNAQCKMKLKGSEVLIRQLGM